MKFLLILNPQVNQQFQLLNHQYHIQLNQFPLLQLLLNLEQSLTPHLLFNHKFSQLLMNINYLQFQLLKHNQQYNNKYTQPLLLLLEFNHKLLFNMHLLLPLSLMLHPELMSIPYLTLLLLLLLTFQIIWSNQLKLQHIITKKKLMNHIMMLILNYMLSQLKQPMPLPKL